MPSDLNYGIRRAIVPAAGLGTRMRPLTNAIPKEMLPLGRKPLLEYIVDEIRDAGILQVLMVISPGKEMIERYFGDGHKFGLSIEYAIQNQMRGLGDAVLHGEIWCEGETFALVFGDCLIESPSTNVLSMMLQCRSDNSADGVVLTELVSPDRVNKYGILRPKTTTGDQFEIEGIAEKPQIGQAPSLNAVAARYILSSE
ncbi:MAG: sugar phosphate nucleotidyltransferase, partial [Chthonomonadales bacterium]